VSSQKGGKLFVTNFPGLGPELLAPVRRPERLPAWLPRGRTTLVPRASSALYLCWRAMGLRKGERVLIPAFTCDTVNRPLELAGARPVYFNVNTDLSIDWEHLRGLMRAGKRPRAMLWYHYLGVPLEFDAIRAFCREEGLYLIEDCAHALFSEHRGRPVGAFGDVSVFSIRKTLPVLQAGALVVNNHRFRKVVKVPWRAPTPGQAAYLRRKEAFLYRLHFQAQNSARQVQRQHFRGVLNDLARYYGNPAAFPAIDPLSRLVMHNADPGTVRRRMRRNFRVYLGELGELALIPRLPAGASPRGFPVKVKRRPALRRRLERLGVETLTHWWAPLLPRGIARRFPDALALAETVLTLPCHQDIGRREIEYVCRSLKKLI